MALAYLEFRIRTEEEHKKRVVAAFESIDVTLQQAALALVDYVVEHNRLPDSLRIPATKDVKSVTSVVTLDSIEGVVEYLHAED